VYGLPTVSVPPPIATPVASPLFVPSPKLSVVVPIEVARQAAVTVNVTASGAVWGSGTVQAIVP
jgi:hypothetical protein